MSRHNIVQGSVSLVASPKSSLLTGNCSYPIQKDLSKELPQPIYFLNKSLFLFLNHLKVLENKTSLIYNQTNHFPPFMIMALELIVFRNVLVNFQHKQSMFSKEKNNIREEKKEKRLEVSSLIAIASVPRYPVLIY